MPARSSHSTGEMTMSALAAGAIVTLATLGLLTTAAAGVQDNGAFELDRNILQNSAVPDWQAVFNATNNGTVVGFNSVWLNDSALPDVTYFGQGKDTLNPYGSWTCASTNNPTDKADILHAYAALLGAPAMQNRTGLDTYLYFGADRFDNSGTANVGVWLFQSEVGCDAAGSGSFVGNHTDGDLLVVSEFTGGGSVSTINVYRWDGGANGALNTTPVLTGAECIPGSATDVTCGTVNNVTIATPWSSKVKSGAANQLEAGEFFEGGINLNAFFSNATSFRCFAQVFTDTRSSASLTASNLDYTLATFQTCDARVTISPLTATNPVGSPHTYTLRVEKNAGAGWGPAANETVNATITGGVGGFVGGNSSCTTNTTGSCTVTIVSGVSGTTDVSATVNVHIGASTMLRSTDGTHGSSGPARKTWVKTDVSSFTTSSTPNGSAVVPGTSASDTATLVGVANAPTPSGNVTFFLCQPNEVTPQGCPSGGSQIGNPVTLSSGQAASASTTDTLAIGTYCWRAVYSGDDSYKAANHTNAASECFTTVKQTATTTTAATPNGSAVVPGTSASDQATVAGGAGQPTPTGTITFFLCQPSESTAQGCPGGSQIGNPGTLSNGQATSASTTSTTSIGKYCWRAEYSGDGFYAANSHTDGAAECFTTAKQVSTTSTTSTPSGTGVLPGTSASDAATIRGGSGQPTPTGTVTFFLCDPSQVTSGGCEGDAGHQEGAAATLSSGQAASISTANTTAYGTYCWRAAYSGDGFYLGSNHTDRSAECFTVKASSDTTTTPSEASIVLGGTASDAATVSGTGFGTPTGSVSFFVCSPAELTNGRCLTGGTGAGTKTLDAGGMATSDAVTPTSAGTWCFRGEYSGDGNYLASSDSRASECFAVTPAASATSTSVTDRSVTLGSTNTDTAQVTGNTAGGVPTGSVAFYACNGACPSGGSSVGSASLDASGRATSPAFTPTGLGTWCFRGEYGGDGNYQASADDGADECFTVTKALSSPSTTPTGASITLGDTNADQVTVTGNDVAGVPTGSVTFYVCEGACAAGGRLVSTEPLDASGQATSASFTPTSAGTWCFRAEYSGDANYEASSEHEDRECFDVAKAGSLPTTTPGASSMTLGGSNHDVVRVEGNAAGGAPTGSVTFYVCHGPCAAGGSHVSTEPLDANGEATSAEFTPAGAGMWCFRAEYSGDANYEASSEHADRECFGVAKAGSTASTAPAHSSITLGAANSDAVRVTGNAAGGVPTGSVAFYVCQDACAAGGTLVSTELLDANGEATSAEFTPTSARTWCFRAEYRGDANYDGSTDDGSDECFDVAKADADAQSVPTQDLITIGEANTDTVRVTGNAAGGTPTGDVDFFACEGACATGGTRYDTEPLDASGKATSASFTPARVGTWCFRADYLGNANYLPGSDGSVDECFTVVKADATTSTAAASSAITLGDSNADTVRVTGNAINGVPTGSVAFFVCPGDCAAGGSPVSTEPLDANGEATSASFTPTSAGTWCFRGDYSGDANYTASSDDGRNECFTVAKAESSTTTVPAQASIVFGGSDRDTVRVSGNPAGGIPTGNVRFFICSPAQADASGRCGTAGTDIGSVALDARGEATSAAYTPTSAGTWCFRGEYVGDANYEPSTDSGPGECFTVTKAAPALSTTSTPTGGNVVPGTTTSDLAVVTGVAGQAGPTGNVTFTLCAPQDTTSDGCPSGGDLVGTTSLQDGRATSPATSATVAIGTFCWRASYGGDGNYLASTHTNRASECFTTVRQAAGLTTLAVPRADDVVPGSSAYDDATLRAVQSMPLPTGDVTFFLCGPSQVTAAGCTSGTQVGGPVTISDGRATSTLTNDTALEGRYCWRAVYGGDALYVAGTHTNNDTECFTVRKLDLGAFTTASLPTGPDVGSGSEASDTATLQGQPGFPAPTGTLRFFLCAPGQSTSAGCTTGGTQVGGAMPVGSGTVRSPTTTDTRQLGTYCWRVEYSGDGLYATTTHTNSGSECFTTKAGDLCMELPDHPLCAQPSGPALCDAVGVDVRVLPQVLAPVDAAASIAPTWANATGAPGHVHGEAAMDGASGLDLVKAAVVRSVCDAEWDAAHASAAGQAQVTNLTIDLKPLGHDITLDATALTEDGFTRDGPSGGNKATMARITARVAGGTIDIPVSYSSDLDLSPVVHVWASEHHQDVRNGCLRNHGDALRLRVPDLVSKPTRAVEIVVSWVSTSVCPIGASTGAPALRVDATPTSLCSASAVTVDVTPTMLAPRGMALRFGTAKATASRGSGHGHGMGDAVWADVSPGLVHASTLDATCDADAAAGNAASGSAGVQDLSIDLTPLGVPVQLHADAVREAGRTASGASANDADTANLAGTIAGMPLPGIDLREAPNTVTPLGTFGYVVVNEQSTGACTGHGTALHIVVYAPGTTDVMASIRIGDVDTAAC